MRVTPTLAILLAFIAGIMVICGASGWTIGIVTVGVFLFVQLLGYVIGKVFEWALQAMVKSAFQTDEEGQAA